MNIKNNFRALLLSNFCISGIILFCLPATAASLDVKNTSSHFQSIHQRKNSDSLLASVNSQLAEEAFGYINSALQLGGETTFGKSNPEDANPFDSAVAYFEKAADSLKKAGMHDTAKKMENCIKALNNALEATSSEEEDKFIEQAVEYLNQVTTDIQKVRS